MSSPLSIRPQPNSRSNYWLKAPRNLRLENEYGYKFTQRVEWIPSLNIHYYVGVDGIGIVMVLMAALVAFAATCCAQEIQTREKEFYILLLLMTGGILGAFMSLDIFLMYFLHELALVPTFIMIGVWGRGQDKDFAAYKITLYLSLGALLTLAGVIMLYLQFGSFSLLSMMDHGTQFAGTEEGVFSATKQNVIFALLMFGLGILVGLWPFHTWAPLGYSAAPTATAMMHAGVIKKFGLFMLIKVALPLLPRGRTNVATDPRPALPWQHPLLRTRCHAPERLEPAHWQLVRGAHGFCLSRNRQRHRPSV